MALDLQRRDFMRLGAAGVAATSTLAAASPAAAAVVCTTPLQASTFNLAITSTQIEMVDGTMVPMLSYARVGGAGPKVPGPVMRVIEGQAVSITISNGRPEAHGFEIAGIPGATMRIMPGQTCRLTFTAPVAGTYMYHDPSAPTSRSLYRLLGMYGAFIVHPTAATGWSVADASKRCITPYSMSRMAPVAAQRVSSVFEAFGTTERFPGGKWVPCPIEQDYSYQEKIWIFSEIDPRLNMLIRSTGVASSAFTTSDATIRTFYTPRYFLINGRSGYDLADGYDVLVKNYVGEPTLIRTLNAGVCHHATHIHGNHLFELAHSILSTEGLVPTMGSPVPGTGGDLGKVILHDNIWERDVWPTWPMQTRDMLLPLEAPPDIPDWQKYERQEAAERFPLRYVMHDHCEMGTTAAGGNYPQGAVTHWEIAGPVGGRNRAPT